MDSLEPGERFIFEGPVGTAHLHFSCLAQHAVMCCEIVSLRCTSHTASPLVPQGQEPVLLFTAESQASVGHIADA